MSETVRVVYCPQCSVRWTLCPPVWLGWPWTREEADRLLARHSELVHA